jgi:hypothetical protein
VVAHIGSWSLIKGQKCSTKCGKHRHDEASDCGDQRRVFSEGGRDGDDERDDKSDIACRYVMQNERKVNICVEMISAT